MNDASGDGGWRGHWTWSTAVLFVLVLVVGCEGGCDIDGFTEAPFPESAADKTQAGSAEVRLTSHGLAFMEGEIDNLLGEFMDGDDGLSFCIPPTETDDADLCHEDTTCADGSTGCQVDLDIKDVQLNPEAPDQLIADIVIDDLLEQMPVTIHTWPNPDCWLDLYGDSDDEAAEIPVTAPLKFSVDSQSPFNDIRVDIDEVEVDVDGVDFNISGRDGDAFGCGVVNVGASLFENTLRDMITEEVDDMVEGLTRAELCRGCGDDALPCPTNSECEEDDDEVPLCMYDEDECVPRLLGIEGLMELDEFIGEYLPSGVADVHVTGRIADRAEADSGLSLGMRAGVDPEYQSVCAPINPTARPSFDAIDPAPSLNDDYTPDGDEFMFGFGMHKRTLQHVLWSVWASGALCAEIGHEQVDMLTTGAIGALVDSVDDISTRSAPMIIRLTPQQAPDVRLGANLVDGDEVEEGLITLEWDDLDIHMYGHVQERYARLFTLRLDLELPIAVAVDGDDGLLPVLGDFEEAFENLRIIGDELVDADEETFEELIPMLLGLAVPELLEALEDPVELPEFFGYQIVIEDGDLTAIDDDEYIGLFANLEYVGLDDTSLQRMAAQASITGHQLHVEQADRRIPDVSLLVDVAAEQSGIALSGPDAEYLYRLNGGPWRPAGAGPNLVIDNPVLAAQGTHQLELRARHKEDGASWQRQPTGQQIVVDYQPPVVEAWQVGDEVAVSATDVVDDAEQMQMRHRFVVDGDVGQWTSWSDIDNVELDESASGGDVTVDLEVRDRAGQIGEQSLAVRPQPLGAGADEPMADSQPRTGCSTGGTTAGGLLGGLIVMLLLFAMRLMRRKRALMSVIVVAVFALSGCSDDTTTQESCPEQCPDGQTCIDGECTVPSCDDTGECVDLNCEESGHIGVCEDGECTCALACDGECSESQFCCHKANGCTSYPDPCADQTCEDGYQAQVTDLGEVDQEICQASGGQCECVVMEPISLRYHGSYPSIDTNDGLTVVAVHNIGYGDLMVGELKGTNVGQWHFVDGVPAGGVVAGDPDGPRDGIITDGEEVGTHTATAVEDDLHVHVFYRHEDDDSLRYARGIKGDPRGPDHDEFDFEITTVEDDVDTGYYTEVVLRDGVLELFYVARVDDETSEIRHRAIDVDTAVEDVSETDFQVLHSGTTPAVEIEDYPRVAGLFLQVVEDDDGQLFASFFDNTTQEIGWLIENGDEFGAPTFLDVDNAGPFASARPDADGTVHIAYMDSTEPALFYQTEDGQREHVVDGIRDTVGGWSKGPVGHDVQLDINSSNIEVLYHDASIHELRRVVRTGDDEWEGETLAGVGGETSPGHGLFVRALDVGVHRLVVDFSVDTTEEDHPVAHPTFRTID